MHHLPRYKWYLAAAAMAAVARWSVVAFAALLLTSMLVRAFPTQPVAISAFLLLACGTGTLIIASILRCPCCKRRVLLTWNQNNPENLRVQALGWRDRIKDFFFPSELVGREVRCVHCGTWLLLRGEA